MLTSFLTLAALPLAADINALIEVVVIIIAIIGWLLGQIGVMVKKAQQVGQPPAPQPDEQPAIPAAPANPREAQLTDEIEQFLREAAERRSGRPPVLAEEAAAPRRPAGKQGRSNRSRRGREPVTQNALDPPAQPQPVERPVSHESVATHVQSHLDTHEFADRAAHLAKVESEKKIDEHLHKAFDHELSRLAGTTLESRGSTPGTTDAAATVATTAQMSEAAGPATRGAGLAALLADPGNLRNAIILNEIMQRPEHRWEE